MPSAIPPDDEIQRFAELTGKVDAQGRYTAPRAQLVAGAVAFREDQAQGRERRRESTAARLVAFRDDMTAELLAAGEFDGYAKSNAHDIMKSLAPALVRREGLKLKGDPHP